MNEEWQDCLFCGLDVDIDDNPEWDSKIAFVAIAEKYPTLEEGELFWACRKCEGLMNIPI